MLQNATPLRKSAPWPPNISDEHVSCSAPATENASLQILFKCPTLAIVFGNATKPSRFCSLYLTFDKVHNPLRLPRETTSERPKVVRACGVFMCFSHFDFEMCFAPQRRALFRPWNFQKWRKREVFLAFFTCKCASRHNGVHFFDIVTAKSPDLVCFVHFDFEMCFAPQRRALFGFIRHLNFQNWSELAVFFSFFTCKCASRHNGVHFFDISTSKSGPELRCFTHFDLEMGFAPQQRAIFHLSSGQRAYFSSLRSHKSLEKHKSFATLRLHFLSSDPFSSLIFFLLPFSSLTLPTPAFPSVHIVGSLTSKFPSGLYMYIHTYIYMYIYVYIWRDHTIWKAVGVVR